MAGAAYPAIIHVNKTLAKFSQHIFGVCSRFLGNKTFIPLTLQLPILFIFFFGVRSVRGVQIFELLGKKLLGSALWCFGYQRMKKKREKVHCLQGANPVLPQGEWPLRGNSREYFQRTFGVVPDFQETNDFEPNFATPSFVYLFFWGKIGKRGSNF